jgi:hypothetical protein
MDKHLTDPEIMVRILDDFNASTLDPVGPVGTDLAIGVLSEMNSLVDDHDQFVWSLMPSVYMLGGKSCNGTAVPAQFGECDMY